jgi:hypothetical protein
MDLKTNYTFVRKPDTMRQIENISRKRGPLFFIVLGTISVIWFLLRVIPKPSRITYPCQRMAAANTVAFITWLLGTFFSMTLIKKAKGKLKESKIPIATLLIILAIVTGITTLTITSFDEIRASIKSDPQIFTPTDLNQPIGIATGIYPGRVTWAHDQGAVTFKPAGTNGFWWEDKNTNPERVADMFSHALEGVTGATSSADAWDILFRYTNLKRGMPDIGYSAGEKIAIKVNLVMGLAGGQEQPTCPGPTPQVLNAILTDLIVDLQIPGEMITVYDASARIPDYIMSPFKNNTNPEFQKVRFVGNPKYVTDNRYLPAEADMNAKIHFADTSVTDIYWVKTLTEADYFINLGNMKGHTMAGVTFCAKNLYGSIFIPAAVDTVSYGAGFGPKNIDDHGGLHKCAAVHDFQDGNVGYFPARQMGSYNYLVDLLGYPDVYNKALLYIVDGLYAGKQQNQLDKFTTFGNHYTASVFLSQDPIALESVCLDFLRSEQICAVNVYGNVDNYLHEGALADNPPSGVIYNPDAGEDHLHSLGVHEHWNNSTDRKYTRNLGTGDGIELVPYEYPYTSPVSVLPKNLNNIESLKNYPNPFSGSTTIEYSIVKSTRVEICIFDNTGKCIETIVLENNKPGLYQYIWNAARKPAGVYRCRIRTSESETSTISLLKTE